MIFKQLKTLAVRLAAGANVATVMLLWLVGYSDCVSPVAHPYLASLGLFFPAALLLNLAFVAFWVFFKWRMVAIPVTGYLLAYFPLRTYIPFNVRQEPTTDCVKLVSFNVCNFTGVAEGTTRTDDVIYEYLAGCEADIICLQEADRHSRAHARLDSLYGHSQLTQVGGHQANTLAIYSHYPILRTEPIDYASGGNGSLAHYLRVGRDTVVVVNNHFESTHLTLGERERYKEMLKGEVGRDTARAESRRLLARLAESAALRAPQADSVHAYLERVRRRHPVVVCGDFNDNPISYTRRTVAKGLTDCYVAAGRGLGVSYNQKGFLVRIDNVMCSEAFLPVKCLVDDDVRGSDHYPIVCWLKKSEVP